MAEAELDPAVIKRTQETLGKYVKKPPLTEKLLKKPPFRFLHDVFKAVIKETGCFDGLYNDDELNFENIKDREDKMRFLQKMIDVIKLTTQRELNVRTSKIVAGHEPERTNELLKLIGDVIEKQLDWKKAVQAIANGAVSDVDKEKGKNTKKKDVKIEEKARGGSKEVAKSKPAKETKSKESKSSKNVTPSPDEKTKKTIKAAPKDKEKTLSRQATTEKVSKATKEKEKITKKAKDGADKMKTIKSTKEQSKRISPTSEKPVQNGIHVDKSNNDSKERQKSIETTLINDSTKENRRPSNESLPKQMSKECLNDLAHDEKKRRNSKQSDELVSEIPVNLTVNSSNEANAITNSPGSRKSSANHERKANSSGKSRRTSVTKSSPIELYADHGTQQAVESVQSLKTVNEEVAKVEATTSSNNQQPTESPIPKAVKREPTFTHENSRESVASNSNSSTARPRTSLRPPSVRPPSARPGAPRRRDKNVEIILQPNDQIKMSNINVKLDTFGDLDDDGENLVIIEDATTSAINLVEENNTKLDTEQLEQQGHLVQQILETQKELTQQTAEIGLKGEKDNVEMAYDANARQSSARQMNNLRDIIQTLTKSVNPFGKLMDFIPEDIDAMQLELNMWRDTYNQASSDLRREKSLTESATEPMKNQLITIEANIKEYLEMIDASRVKILQNSDKIYKMLLEK